MPWSVLPTNMCWPAPLPRVPPDCWYKVLSLLGTMVLDDTARTNGACVGVAASVGGGAVGGLAVVVGSDAAVGGVMAVGEAVAAGTVVAVGTGVSVAVLVAVGANVGVGVGEAVGIGSVTSVGSRVMVGTEVAVGTSVAVEANVADVPGWTVGSDTRTFVAVALAPQADSRINIAPTITARTLNLRIEPPILKRS